MSKPYMPVSTEKAVRDISKATECVVWSLNANPGRSGTLLESRKNSQ
jgi:hypothetical protein